MTEVGIATSREASTDFVTTYQKDDHRLGVILDHRAMVISKVGCQEQTMSSWGFLVVGGFLTSWQVAYAEWVPWKKSQLDGWEVSWKI